MQEEVAEADIKGPLDEPSTGGAARIKAHLQKEVTKQREGAATERFTRDMHDLLEGPGWVYSKPGDLRANSFLQSDKMSVQFLLTLPNMHNCLSPSFFGDILARYLGLPLPTLVLDEKVGLPLPCSLNGRGA